MEKIISLLGVVIILGIAFLFSNDKRKINYKMVLTGLVMQVALALAILKVPFIESFFAMIGDGVNKLFQFTAEGTKFLFGNLMDASSSTGFIFALQILPTIIFVSAIMSVLYYYGIMQVVIKYLGAGVKKLLGTSGAETMTAVANMFVGQTEAPLFVKPYIDGMTKSEVLTMMVAGMGTISVGSMAGYAGLGISTTHLLAASIIAAPSAIIISKIMCPETEVAETAGKVEIASEKTHRTVIEAFSEGTSQGLMLALNVAAMLLTFLAFIAMLNAFLGWVGGFVGFPTLSLSWILGRIFSPIAFILGIPAKDVFFAGDLLGKKLVMNEFVSYIALADAMKANAIAARTAVIMTYALCGFANIASIGIQLAGIGGIAPKQKSQLASYGVKALIGGTLVTLLNAAIIGVIL